MENEQQQINFHQNNEEDNEEDNEEEEEEEEEEIQQIKKIEEKNEIEKKQEEQIKVQEEKKREVNKEKEKEKGNDDNDTDDDDEEKKQSIKKNSQLALSQLLNERFAIGHGAIQQFSKSIIEIIKKNKNVFHSILDWLKSDIVEDEYFDENIEESLSSLKICVSDAIEEWKSTIQNLIEKFEDLYSGENESEIDFDELEDDITNAIEEFEDIIKLGQTDFLSSFNSLINSHSSLLTKTIESIASEIQKSKTSFSYSTKDLVLEFENKMKKAKSVTDNIVILDDEMKEKLKSRWKLFHNKTELILRTIDETILEYSVNPKEEIDQSFSQSKLLIEDNFYSVISSFKELENFMRIQLIQPILELQKFDKNSRISDQINQIKEKINKVLIQFEETIKTEVLKGKIKYLNDINSLQKKVISKIAIFEKELRNLSANSVEKSHFVINETEKHDFKEFEEIENKNENEKSKKNKKNKKTENENNREEEEEQKEEEEDNDDEEEEEKEEEEKEEEEEEEEDENQNNYDIELFQNVHSSLKNKNVDKSTILDKKLKEQKEEEKKEKEEEEDSIEKDIQQGFFKSQQGGQLYSDELDVLSGSDSSGAEDIMINSKADRSTVLGLKKLRKQLIIKDKSLREIYSHYCKVCDQYRVGISKVRDQITSEYQKLNKPSKSKRIEEELEYVMIRKLVQSKSSLLSNHSQLKRVLQQYLDEDELSLVTNRANIEDSIISFQTFQNILESKHSYCTNILKIINTAHSQLRSDYLKVRRFLKDSKRGIYITNEFPDVSSDIPEHICPKSFQELKEESKDLINQYEEVINDLNLILNEKKIESKKFEETLMEKKLHIVTVLLQYATVLEISRNECLRLQIRENELSMSLNRYRNEKGEVHEHYKKLQITPNSTSYHPITSKINEKNKKKSNETKKKQKQDNEEEEYDDEDDEDEDESNEEEEEEDDDSKKQRKIDSNKKYQVNNTNNDKDNNGKEENNNNYNEKKKVIKNKKNSNSESKQRSRVQNIFNSIKSSFMLDNDETILEDNHKNEGDDGNNFLSKKNLQKKVSNSKGLAALRKTLRT